MELRIIALKGIPELHTGDNLSQLIVDAAGRSGLQILTGDVLVVAQKAISKVEGQVISLTDVVPSPFAQHVAHQTDKDPREVEVILSESNRMVRMVRGSLIMETHHGYVCANAGIDRSNVAQEQVCLLPVDPDASAGHTRREIADLTGARIAVVIADTFGRPWRLGQTNVAIGLAGMLPLRDYRGQTDTYGNELRVTQLAVADELAGAAELVMGKKEAVPAVIIRGFAYPEGDGKATDMVRPAETDMFR